jgi:hypothetical protein
LANNPEVASGPEVMVSQSSTGDGGLAHGTWALGVLFIIFGAVVNTIYLAAGTDYYADFASASSFPYVRDTWDSLVLPHQGFFIGLRIIAEATARALILSGGRGPRPG